MSLDIISQEGSAPKSRPECGSEYGILASVVEYPVPLNICLALMI
jgi:hypothetical protein